jgi:hypothetical protein
LIDKGLRLRDLGTPHFEWCDLKAIISTAGPDTHLFRELYPDEWQWDLHAHMLADLIDLTHLLVWFKTKDGAKGRNRPKPYPRPGVEDEGSRTVKGTARPLDEVRSRLSVPRTAA